MVASPAALSARRLRKTLSPIITDAVENSRADRYRKSFGAFAHVWMLLIHTMSANDSLRQSHAQQASDMGLRRRLGMEEWVSFSQLARSSTSRDPKCFESLFASLVREAKSRPAAEGGSLPRFLGKTAALDCTFFSLSGKLSPWSRHKRHDPRVGLQTELDLERMIPAKLSLTTPEVNDRRALKEWDLCGLGGWTLVFDLGYYAHAHFERLRKAGVSFITRLQSQARYEPIPENLPSVGERTPEGDVVLSDEAITLGSPNNRTGAVLEGMRLVRSQTEKGEIHALITDRHDLTACEVVRLYRKRWQIELFFRWIKRQLKTLHAFGASREAVWLTVLVAAIVAVIAMLAEGRRPKGLTRVSWMRALCVGFTLLRFSG